MGEFTLPGDPPIPVRLRRSARSRRLSLRLSQLDGRVTLTMPLRVPDAEAIGFLHEKERWLRGHMARRDPEVAIAPGARFPLEGLTREVRQSDGRQIVLDGATLRVPGPASRVGPRLQGWLKARARDRLATSSDGYAAALGLPYTRLTLRDPRSRWGSCTSDGGLMYSWRLILAPPDVLDYVAAHEVAHLAQMNHGPDFWRTVRALYGEWADARDWLRTEGAGLHRYRFGD